MHESRIFLSISIRLDICRCFDVVCLWVCHTLVALLRCQLRDVERAIDSFTAKCRSSGDGLPPDVASKIEDVASLKASIKVRAPGNGRLL